MKNLWLDPGGWRPGDGRNASKPGQRSFSKPGAPRREGFGGGNGGSNGGGYGSGNGNSNGGYKGSHARSGEGSGGNSGNGGYKSGYARSGDAPRRPYGDR